MKLLLKANGSSSGAPSGAAIFDATRRLPRAVVFDTSTTRDSPVGERPAAFKPTWMDFDAPTTGKLEVDARVREEETGASSGELRRLLLLLWLGSTEEEEAVVGRVRRLDAGAGEASRLAGWSATTMGASSAPARADRIARLRALNFASPSSGSVGPASSSSSFFKRSSSVVRRFLADDDGGRAAEEAGEAVRASTATVASSTVAAAFRFLERVPLVGGAEAGEPTSSAIVWSTSSRTGPPIAVASAAAA